MRSTTTRRRILGLGAAAMAAATLLAGPAGAAQAATQSIEARLTLCVVDQITPRIDCTSSTKTLNPAPAGIFSKDFSISFQPSGSPLRATYDLRVSRVAGGQVFGQAIGVVLVDTTTGRRLGVTSGPIFAAVPNATVSKSTTVVDSVNFPPGTPEIQANNATGNVKLKWLLG